MTAKMKSYQGPGREQALEALIFDIDMTICENYLRKRMAIERGLNLKVGDDIWPTIERSYSFREILRSLNCPLSEEEAMRRVGRHFFRDEDLFEYDRPFPGAVETLWKLAERGYKMYYVTGRPLKRTAKRFLSKFGFPPGRVLSRKVGFNESWKKVDMFRSLIKEEGLDASKVAAVGDLPGDAEAAKEIGLLAIGICQGGHVSRSDLERSCDHVFDDLTELTGLLCRAGP